MEKASGYAYIPKAKPKHVLEEQGLILDQSFESEKSESIKNDLNVFVVTFQKMKQAEKSLAGGDPYQCKHCKAILNKFSTVQSYEQILKSQIKVKVELEKNQSYWDCQFCNFPNVITIEKEEISVKDDVVYMLEGALQEKVTDNDSTLIFCIDVSGSMNTTSEVEGKIDLKFGMSQEEIDMLKQFMEPGDQEQFHHMPGQIGNNKTFISRKQCILSAIQSQLNDLKKIDPHKKVGFVTFNSEVTAFGDSKVHTENIVGDKLYNKEAIINSLKDFKLTDSIFYSFDNLINSLNKTEAKGQTALGPALVTSIQIASKGNPGSSVILCTDGLANIGIGQLQPLDEGKKKFYEDLAEIAKVRNISVSIMTIKGQGCKMQVIGKLAELTNGNMKVVNPQKLSEDFANVLKDQVVGLNVTARIMLHKSMKFRNEEEENLKENKRILEKKFANATTNTKISFEYEVRKQDQLEKQKIDIENLKKIPFQTQIIYTSLKGGNFLRVISCELDATSELDEMKKQANLEVVHQRVAVQTAALYSKGLYKDSKKFNHRWDNYLKDNFKEKKYEVQQQKFAVKNMKLNKAIKHKRQKSIEKKQAKNQQLSEDDLEIAMNLSCCMDDDQDQMELMENVMGKKRLYSPVSKKSISGKKSQNHSAEKKPRKSSFSSSSQDSGEVKKEKNIVRRNSGRKLSRSRSKSISKKKLEVTPRKKKIEVTQRKNSNPKPRQLSDIE